MVVWFKALANFNHCPAALKMASKFVKSNSSCFVDLNVWHTLCQFTQSRPILSSFLKNKVEMKYNALRFLFEIENACAKKY